MNRQMTHSINLNNDEHDMNLLRLKQSDLIDVRMTYWQ
jgi:hypothetical protein